MKQDESDSDLKLTTTIGLVGKSINYWKTNSKQSWKWRGVCMAYRNPISKSDVGQTHFENRKRPKGHMLFLPQEVVWCEVWTRGFQRRHNYRRQSP